MRCAFTCSASQSGHEGRTVVNNEAQMLTMLWVRHSHSTASRLRATPAASSPAA